MSSYFCQFSQPDMRYMRGVAQPPRSIDQIRTRESKCKLSMKFTFYKIAYKHILYMFTLIKNPTFIQDRKRKYSNIQILTKSEIASRPWGLVLGYRTPANKQRVFPCEFRDSLCRTKARRHRYIVLVDFQAVCLSNDTSRWASGHLT